MPAQDDDFNTNNPFKERLHEIIFEADTPLGKAFDVLLLAAIVASVLVVMLESVDELSLQYAGFFHAIEWVFTILFTVEYLLRLYCVHKPWRYATSFFGIIDLLAILPTYISLLTVGTSYLMVVRVLRLLRIFRIFKLAQYLKESEIILRALRASRIKITVFITFVILAITVVGALMYLIEGGINSGFSSIPRSMYWAIVTITTVGYGDISPVTPIGQLLAAMLMITGYAVIAVPTGIVSAEFANAQRQPSHVLSTQVCRNCLKEGHEADAKFCKCCGEPLNGGKS